MVDDVNAFLQAVAVDTGTIQRVVLSVGNGISCIVDGIDARCPGDGEGHLGSTY